jgi:hypothetical protein
MSDEITLGEIHRSVKRIEAAMEPLVTLPVRMTIAEDDVKQLQAQVDAVQTKALATSGFIAGVGAAINFLFGRH